MATLRSAPRADLSRLLHKAKRQKTRDAQLRDPNHAFDDFLTAFLVKRDRPWLLQCCKLLLAVMQRVHDPTLLRQQQPRLCAALRERPDLAPLLCYDYSTEYYEQLYAEYLCVPLTRDDPVSEDCTEPWLCLRQYFTRLYHLCKQQAQHHTRLLRGFLIVLLVYDLRVRRFVLAKHDVHYKYLSTHPPETPKTLHFLAACRPWVDRFLRTPDQLSLGELGTLCTALWIDQYMLER
jgi:hypothetical protein